MSYYLHFYRRNDNKLNNSEIISEIKKLVPKNISEIESQINYENESTGVYFLIDFNEPNREKEDIEIFDCFEGFENLNISTSINFFRPDYFGKEIFPIIADFSEKLDLFMLNLQEFDESRHKPLKWTEKELIEHWTEHNSIVSKTHGQEHELKFMDKEKSDYFWSYTSQIDKLENEIKEDIYIPKPFVLQNKESQELFTAIAWTQSIPLILPKVDFVIILKKYKKLFKNVEEIGMVKYQDILEKFASEFEVYDSENKLLILRQSNADKIKKDFNAFPIWRSHKDFGPQIGFDGFVNHR
jgi:hypothetical protein